jgi:hypothetical protein
MQITDCDPTELRLAHVAAQSSVVDEQPNLGFVDGTSGMDYPYG